MNKIELPDGMDYGEGPDGQRVCRGAQMGRCSRVPSEPSERGKPFKMRLILLPFIDGDYDKWGAYWGSPANVFYAVSVHVAKFGDSLQTVELFLRANSRDEAKVKVRETLPHATFYR